jgi:hypothetical protein
MIILSLNRFRGSEINKTYRISKKYMQVLFWAEKGNLYFFLLISAHPQQADCLF